MNEIRNSSTDQNERTDLNNPSSVSILEEVASVADISKDARIIAIEMNKVF